MMHTGRKTEDKIDRTVFKRDLSEILVRLAPERSDSADGMRDRWLRFTDEADAVRWEAGQLREGFELDYSASRIPMQRF